MPALWPSNFTLRYLPRIFIALLLVIAEKPGHSPEEWRNRLWNNGILLSNKRKRITDKCDKASDSQKHVETKRLDYILYVKNYEWLETLPHLGANQPCHLFTDAGKRNRAPGSVINDCSTRSYSNSQSISIFLHRSPNPIPTAARAVETLGLAKLHPL